MKRLPDWRGRFAAAISTSADIPHRWGKHDCLVGHVGPAVLAVTGEDIFSEHVGQYDSPETALAYMNAKGFACLGDWLGSLFPEIHPSRVGIADVIVIEMGESPAEHAMGMVIGDRVMVLAPQGKATASLHRISRAFRVG